MIDSITPYLPDDYPWLNRLYRFMSVTSTNGMLKKIAQVGAPEGTALVANAQTQGRGRLGRSFHSPAEQGLYMSVLLRPLCPPEKLMHLTCATAVAVCDGIGDVTGFRPQIKWINDLVFRGKKLGGILTELGFTPDGLVEYAVIGIGLNVSACTFPPELRSIACSLEEAVGCSVSREALAAAILSRLAHMNRELLSTACLERYRKDCVTLGSHVRVIQDTQVRSGIAREMADNGSLLVEFDNGAREWVNSGEVSVRGLWDYV